MKKLHPPRRSSRLNKDLQAGLLESLGTYAVVEEKAPVFKSDFNLEPDIFDVEKILQEANFPSPEMANVVEDQAHIHDKEPRSFVSLKDPVYDAVREYKLGDEIKDDSNFPNWKSSDDKISVQQIRI